MTNFFNDRLILENLFLKNHQRRTVKLDYFENSFIQNICLWAIGRSGFSALEDLYVFDQHTPICLT